MARRKVSQPDIDMDLTPMIDVIFLLIIFFILAGKITADITNELITVPPTKTAEPVPDDDFRRIRLEVHGTTQDTGAGSQPMHMIKLGTFPTWRAVGSTGEAAFHAYQRLRQELDRIYDMVDKYPDPNGTGIMLPKVVLELRADALTEYRIIQEIQQVASDSVNPFANENGDFMTTKTPPGGPASMRPFVNFQFTTRLPGD